jgi:hypothetical protein
MALAVMCQRFAAIKGAIAALNAYVNSTAAAVEQQSAHRRHVGQYAAGRSPIGLSLVRKIHGTSAKMGVAVHSAHAGMIVVV